MVGLQSERSAFLDAGRLKLFRARKELVFSPTGSDPEDEPTTPTSLFYSLDHPVTGCAIPRSHSHSSTGSLGNVMLYADAQSCDDKWRAEYAVIASRLIQKFGRGYLSRLSLQKQRNPPDEVSACNT
eukprot:TRINITY_DN11156_c0_g1_i1.p1 TRINITY_DN11156_c0_g1~~TRINITY_DN11156_c0_g1_i1.p1  ORF type:complete len:145 (+),score=22.54 TRINITY_DN11156_c0_g1_i1:57-437(+)